MTERDPFELLGELDWQYLDQPLQRGEEPALDDLLVRITALPQRRFPRLPGRAAARSPLAAALRYAIAVLAAIGVVGAGVAAAAVLLGRAADPVRVSCYSNAAIDPVSQVSAQASDDLDPVDLCTPFWNDGTLGKQGPPELVACVSFNDITVVMPGSADTCAALGLQPSGGAGPTDAATTAIASAATKALLSECFTDLEKARQAVLVALDGLDAAGWTVRVEGTTDAAAPCAGVVVDPTRRTIQIVPIERNPS